LAQLAQVAQLAHLEKPAQLAQLAQNITFFVKYENLKHVKVHEFLFSLFIILL